MTKLTSLMILFVATSFAFNPLDQDWPIEVQLTSAVKNGYPDVVAEILQNKNSTIDVNLPVYGKTHLTRAAINSLLYTHSFMDWFYVNPYVDVIRILIKHGADPCVLTRESAYVDGEWLEMATTMQLYKHYALSPRDDILRMISCK